MTAGDSPDAPSDAPSDAEPGGIFTDGGVSLFDGSAFVSFRTTETSWQMTTAETREFAMTLIRTADAADEDADLFKVFRRIGMEDRIIGGIVGDLRVERLARG